VTEVHHVNGEGQNAGVVYCEMQARENKGESLLHLNMLRAMYPGHCGYKSETGGIMKNLRETCSHLKVSPQLSLTCHHGDQQNLWLD
jgi:Zn-dependent M16 (insulinase) family peptidase